MKLEHVASGAFLMTSTYYMLNRKHSYELLMCSFCQCSFSLVSVLSVPPRHIAYEPCSQRTPRFDPCGPCTFFVRLLTLQLGTSEDAFPDLARRYEMRFNPEILKLGSFSSKIFQPSSSSS